MCTWCGSILCDTEICGRAKCEIAFLRKWEKGKINIDVANKTRQDISNKNSFLFLLTRIKLVREGGRDRIVWGWGRGILIKQDSRDAR